LGVTAQRIKTYYYWFYAGKVALTGFLSDPADSTLNLRLRKQQPSFSVGLDKKSIAQEKIAARSRKKPRKGLTNDRTSGVVRKPVDPIMAIFCSRDPAPG
jgi:hypothetical protein